MPLQPVNASYDDMFCDMAKSTSDLARMTDSKEHWGQLPKVLTNRVTAEIAQSLPSFRPSSVAHGGSFV